MNKLSQTDMGSIQNNRKCHCRNYFTTEGWLISPYHTSIFNFVNPSRESVTKSVNPSQLNGGELLKNSDNYIIKVIFQHI